VIDNHEHFIPIIFKVVAEYYRSKMTLATFVIPMFFIQANYTLRGVTYNSEYWVEVERNGVTSSRLTFETPGCTNQVDGFRRCRYHASKSRVFATPNPPPRVLFTKPAFDSGIYNYRYSHTLSPFQTESETTSFGFYRTLLTVLLAFVK